MAKATINLKDITAEDLQRIFKEMFVAGFLCGACEQRERDFPDVGFRFDKEAEDYWEDYKDLIEIQG